MSSGPQRLYMGVDIESGSPETPERARYSVAVVDQDLRLVLKAQGVSLAGGPREGERRPDQGGAVPLRPPLHNTCVAQVHGP